MKIMAHKLSRVTVVNFHQLRNDEKHLSLHGYFKTTTASPCTQTMVFENFSHPLVVSSVAFHIRTEAAMYEIYENKMHTKYSGITVFEKSTKLISTPKFLPPGLQAFRSSVLAFTLFFGQFESTKLNSIRKVFNGKVRNFSPTKISSFTG